MPSLKINHRGFGPFFYNQNPNKMDVIVFVVIPLAIIIVLVFLLRWILRLNQIVDNLEKMNKKLAAIEKNTQKLPKPM
jgi:cadmium resistance protein CadD (predicted permease)